LTVSALITSIASKFDHSYDNQDILDLINEVEQSVYSEYIKEFDSAVLATVAEQSAYDLSTGVSFDAIESLFVNGSEYKKRDLRQHETKGFYKDGDGKLCLYPVPTTTDAVGSETVLIVYRKKPAVKLVAAIETDTLSLPEAFTDIYRYYIKGQICFLQKEFTEGRNWLELFNSRTLDLVKWWGNNRPKAHIPYKRRW
jgi:hypothetical protein